MDTESELYVPAGGGLEGNEGGGGLLEDED